MENQGKMFRQHCERIESDQLLKYTNAVYDEGLSLAVDIAEEIAYRDNIIKRQTHVITELRHMVDVCNNEINELTNQVVNLKGIECEHETKN